MSLRRNKIISRLCKGAPLVIVQLALFGWLMGFSIKGAFEELNPIPAGIYTGLLVIVFGLAILSLFRVYTTEPGCVTKALIEQLKQQLLQPK